MAVCGLAGGCGTTTLAHLIATHAAREGRGPVLLCEPEAPLGGLAVATGRTSAHGVGGVADLFADHQLPDELPCLWLHERLALLAGPPRPRPEVDDAAIRAVLEFARARHSLVVVDCRTTDHPHVPALLAAATHVLWTLPATERALRSADMLRRCGFLPGPGRGREALVAVGVRPAPAVTARALEALARDRHERLILIPHIPELQEGGADAAGSEAILSALTQVATFVRRARCR